MGLLDRVQSTRRGETRFALDQWIADYLVPGGGQFNFGGTAYPFGLNQALNQTLNSRAQEISQTLPGYVNALKGCPPAFAAQMVRALVLSQVRFTFRTTATAASPRRLFGTRALATLERPWPNATTGELVTRMEWHAGPAGNAFVARRPDRLRVLRPDWVAILYGSDLEPDDPAHAIDGELLGYIYVNGGFSSGYTPRTLLPQEVAHWSPLPDPLNAGVGMSWITPAIRDIQGDQIATAHKIKFFENGATPNMVVKGIPAVTADQFKDLVDMMEDRHAGVTNAYRTLYLTAGADATVVGANLQQLDFKVTQGAGETRIAVLSRVPAPLLGIAEGLAGSSLNAGNFGMARRMFADTWVYPTLQDLAATLAPLLRVPDDAELWFDTTDMPILREDARDAADIAQVQAAAIVALVNAGFDPDSVPAAVMGLDMGQLKHTKLLSVQLQPPGAQPALPTGRPVRSRDEDEDEDFDEKSLALLVAITELAGDDEGRAWDPVKHPRIPKGQPGAGRFLSMVNRLKDAIDAHFAGNLDGHPFDGFSREQLRRVAKARGIQLDRGEPRESIAAKLLDHIRPPEPSKPALPPGVDIATHSSGRLHVASPYDKAFVAGVKNLGGTWLPKSKSWSVPAGKRGELEELIHRTYGAPPVPVAGLPAVGRIRLRPNGKVEATTPYNADFAAEARTLGGAWDPTAKAWVFPPHRDAQVRDAVARHYGQAWLDAQRRAEDAKRQARAAAPRVPTASTPMSDRQHTLIRQILAKHRRDDMFWHDFFDGAGGPGGQYRPGGPTEQQIAEWLSAMSSRDASALIDDLIAWGRGY